MSFETKTIETRHAPVKYLEGGAGEPLVFLHGAGGMTAEDPALGRAINRADSATEWNSGASRSATASIAINVLPCVRPVSTFATALNSTASCAGSASMPATT